MAQLLQFFFINLFETMQTSFRCSLFVHIILGSQSNNCLTLLNLVNFQTLFFPELNTNKMFRHYHLICFIPDILKLHR